MNSRLKLQARGISSQRLTGRLRDGSEVVVRPVGPSDVEAEREFLERLSPDTRRQRFGAQFTSPSESLLRQLTTVDQVEDAAFVATANEGGKERIVGACRYARVEHGDDAECAIVVRDDWQGRGLGVLLMQHLIDTGREHGLKRLYSLDAANNTDMAELGRFLGFSRSPDANDASQVVHELAL